MTAVEFPPHMAPSSSEAKEPQYSCSGSVSEGSYHQHSVVSDLLDGDLGVDELNAIPTLPTVDEAAIEDFVFDPMVTTSLLDESHPATQIALTASALDGSLGNFEFMPATIGSQPEYTDPVSIVSDDSTSSKRSRPTPTTGRTAKKRRVTKAVHVHGSPVSTSQTAGGEPPCFSLVSPSNSITSLSECDKASATAPMPDLLPVSGASNVQPLLPKPTTNNNTTDQDSPVPSVPSSTSSKAKKNSKSSSAIKPLVAPDGPANISTEHIRMLISENGPAECAKAIVATTTGVDGRRVSKAHLSEEERAQASRDRNREHARNTRLRKKAYVEELKKTLTALCAQRDANALEEQRKVKLDEQNRNVRFSVLEEFLKLRGSNSPDEGRWAAILMPDFALRTSTIDAADTVEEKTLVGVAQVMGDSQAFSGFLQTIGTGHSAVSLQYSMERSNLFMDGNNALLEWDASTIGAVDKGAKGEIHFHGSIKAQFDPQSNKIVSAAMMFDSGLVLSQKKTIMA